MKLQEIVCDKAIISGLNSDERDGVIGELVDALIGAGRLDAGDRETIIGALLEREKRGSTGFGKGVAVPHVKHDCISSMIAAIGTSASGIDFNALDKEPVYTAFLLLSPADHPEEHLQAMETIFKNLSQDRFRQFLRQADTNEDVWSVLIDADEQQLGV
jgi:mannitol/fructose-specific phosphotransferase system IIA component (Ntr-type)